MLILIRKTVPVLLLLLVCCIEPIEIASETYEKLLIVDGFISGDAKKHRISLSNTSRLNEQEFSAEEGASVTIQDNNGGIVSLTENEPGIYYTPIFAGSSGRTYQLLIQTKDGRKYTSEEVTFKNTPDIKSIYTEYFSDRGDDNGVAIYLDTEDPSGLTRYYRWEIEETYEIKTPFPSNFEWLGGNNIVFRDVPIDHCWATDTSQNIRVASTANLELDRITKHQLTFVPAWSPLLRIKYSLLVRQYALNEDSYLFWKMIHDVNETQGSLFDIQTGAVRGNIRSDQNPDEMVLGYFDAGVVVEKRVFYTPADFKPFGYTVPGYLDACFQYIPVEIPLNEIGEYMEQNHEKMEISETSGFGNVTVSLVPRFCCDCTDKGTNVKPPFWE